VTEKWCDAGSALVRSDERDARQKADRSRASAICHANMTRFVTRHTVAHVLVMADVLRTIKIRIRKIFGHDSLDWFDSSYVIDWYVRKLGFLDEISTICRIVVLGLFLLGHFLRVFPVFERDFSPDDPLIQHPHTSEQ